MSRFGFLPGLRRSGHGASVLAALIGVVVGTAGCEPELGSPCGSPELVNERMTQREGQNHIVRDLAFEPCTQAICVSTNGSRPYCTATCQQDLDCATEAEGFVCEPVTVFGALGCQNPDVVGPCPEDQIIRYCVAPNDVIEARDEELGRTWPAPANDAPDDDDDDDDDAPPPADAGPQP